MQTVTVEVLSWLRGKLGYPEDEKVAFTVPIAEGETVGSLLTRLAADRPAVAEHVYDAAGARLREHVVVILNGRAVELVGGPTAALRDGDRLVLLPGFVGGSSARPHPGPSVRWVGIASRGSGRPQPCRTAGRG